MPTGVSGWFLKYTRGTVFVDSYEYVDRRYLSVWACILLAVMTQQKKLFVLRSPYHSVPSQCVELSQLRAKNLQKTPLGDTFYPVTLWLSLLSLLSSH